MTYEIIDVLCILFGMCLIAVLIFMIWACLDFEDESEDV